jgi:hypothetical protein
MMVDLACSLPSEENLLHGTKQNLPNPKGKTIHPKEHDQ